MIDTVEEFGWEDVFYPNFHQTGKALLYRNPLTITKHDQDGKLVSWSVKYKIYPSTGEPCLFDETPIAQGFTAFAHGCPLVDGTLKYRIEHNNRPNTQALFELYHQTALKKANLDNNRELNPMKGDALKFRLLSDHYKIEKEHLDSSKKYFSECTDEADSVIKSSIKEYAERYLEWIQEQINNIPDNESLNKKDMKQQVREILQKSFITSDDYHFDSLIEHITADKRPQYIPTLIPSVPKIELYKTLAKLIDLGYDRKHLASVFADCCKMDYDLLYTKISH